MDESRLCRLAAAAAMKMVLQQLGFGSIGYPFDGNDPQQVLFYDGTAHLFNGDDIVATVDIDLDERTARVYVEHADAVVRFERLSDFYPDELGFDEPPDINMEVDITEILAEVGPMAELPPPPIKRLRKHRRPRVITNVD